MMTLPTFSGGLYSPPTVCLSVCLQDNSKNYESTFMKLQEQLDHTDYG